MKRTNSTIILGIFTVILILSCGQQKTGGDTGKSLSGNIRIDGSSTVYPISEAVAEEFRIVQKDVRVTIGVSGTGGGFKKFARGETDISDASRPIKQSEADACAANNIGYIELPVAYDGLAVVVNPQNDWVSHLTTEELKRIWEPAAQGKITNWSQIRPGFPNEKLSLMGPGTASGTFDYFTEAIVGESGSSRGDFMPSEDDHVLVQGVAGDKGAIGFFGLAYFEENKDKLKLVSVDNGSGPVSPSLETVKNGTYEPLARPVFIYVSSEAVQKPEVVTFVNFYLDEAGSLVSDVGYIPLPDEDYREIKNRFAEFVNQHK